jgi:hypothetical protein
MAANADGIKRGECTILVRGRVSGAGRAEPAARYPLADLIETLVHNSCDGPFVRGENGKNIGG